MQNEDRKLLSIRDHFQLRREQTGDTSWDWLLDDLAEAISEEAREACRLPAKTPQPDWMFDPRLPVLS